MIGIIATLKIREGTAEDFEQAFASLSKSVRANEPGNLVYQLCRTRSETNTYKVLEIYRNEEALEAHRASAHFRAAGPNLGAVLAAPPDIEYLDAVS